MAEQNERRRSNKNRMHTHRGGCYFSIRSCFLLLSLHAQTQNTSLYILVICICILNEGDNVEDVVGGNGTGDRGRCEIQGNAFLAFKTSSSSRGERHRRGVKTPHRKERRIYAVVEAVGTEAALSFL